MAEDDHNHDLSLDDIFSRLRRDDKGRKKEVAVPFKFLDSYTIEDRNIFFGRERETEDIFRQLYSGKLILVYGKSGTGKSSIINCGLISRIPREDLFTINIRCGQKAYSNFLAGIRKPSKTTKDKPVEILEDLFYEHSKPIALIFDQFEEVFILSNEDERKKLAESLSEILKSRLKINIILVIREEFFASLTEFEPYIPGLYDNRTRIERMSKTSALKVISEPCRVCNVGIEEGLPDKILDHLMVQADGLELTWLQILMDKLYRMAVEREPDQPVILHGDLASLGRMGNVLSDFLDEQLRQMPDGDMGEAVLKTMISTDGTKKQVNISDISDTLQTIGHPMEQKQIEEIIRYFVGVRVITDQDEQGYFELRHDALAARIFDRMTAVEKELVDIKSFLENSYKIYEKRKALLTGNDLKYIALYENKLILNNELNEFIRISRRAVQRTRIRRRAIAIAAVGILFAILTGFTVWAIREKNNALEQTQIAEEQRNQAMQANQAAEDARNQAVEERDRATANEAIAEQQQQIAETQRQQAVAANREAEVARQQALDERNRAVENEQLAVDAQQESENARLEAIRANNEASFYLYLFNGKELANKSLIMQGNQELKALLALTARDLVAYGYRNFSQDNATVKYDIEILQALQEAYLQFEPDSLLPGEIHAIDIRGDQIAYSNQPGKVMISTLQTEDPEELPVLITRTTIELPTRSLVRAIAFDPDSDRLACGTANGNVILIDFAPDGSYRLNTLYNHNNRRIWSLAFIPGRDLIVSSALGDRTIQIWNLTLMGEEARCEVNEPIQEFTLAGADHLLFTSGGKILDWYLRDVRMDIPTVIYTGENRQPLQSIAYNEAHNWLVTSSLGNIMIFTYDPDQPSDNSPESFTVNHMAVVTQLDFSPDNQWLVSASLDAVMLWDLRDVGAMETDKFVPLIIENNRQIFSLAFDRESKYLMYGDNLLMHIHPVDIEDIYTKLRRVTGGRELSQQEWNYYVKGDLERPAPGN